MKKSHIIIASVSALLLLGVAAAAVLVPRFQLQHIAQNELIPMMENQEPASMFEDYDVKDDSFQVIDMKDYSAAIPSDMQHTEDGEFILTEAVQTYRSEDGKTIVVFYEGAQKQPIRMYQPLQNLQELPLLDYGDLVKGAEKLGFDADASVYDELRAVALITPEDAVFWDIDASRAFCHLAQTQCILYSGRGNWIYETDALAGIVYCSAAAYSETKEPAYAVRFAFCDPEERNTIYEISITTDSEEKLHAILNSVAVQ